MFQPEVVEKIKTHILCSVTFFRKSYRLRHNTEKNGRAGQPTDNSIIRRMRIACLKKTNLFPSRCAHVPILLNCAVFTQQTNNGCKLLQLVN